MFSIYVIDKLLRPRAAGERGGGRRDENCNLRDKFESIVRGRETHKKRESNLPLLEPSTKLDAQSLAFRPDRRNSVQVMIPKVDFQRLERYRTRSEVMEESFGPFVVQYTERRDGRKTLESPKVVYEENSDVLEGRWKESGFGVPAVEKRAEIVVTEDLK